MFWHAATIFRIAIELRKFKEGFLYIHNSLSVEAESYYSNSLQITIFYGSWP